MALPSIEQYISVISKKDPTTLFTVIDFDFLCNKVQTGKEFSFSVGTSAVAFKATNGGSTYAIRFFLRGDEDTFKRYETLATFLTNKDFSWKVPFKFLNNEVLIDGHFYPIVKMNWVEGTPLNNFIERNGANQLVLLNLQKKLVALSANLEEADMAHGDLKYNNIFIEKDNDDFTLKLIDYDSMFIPAFAGKKSLEIGSPGFQPLKRLSSHFYKEIDRFSIWVILATIEAVQVDPSIWQKVGKGGFNNEDSLFAASDFFNTSASPIFQQLESYGSDALNFYLQKIILHCKTSDFKAIPKPYVYQHEGVPSIVNQKILHSTAATVIVPQPVFAIEIKTTPSGKDVLIDGEKKGITPLHITVSKKELRKIAVVNEGLITPLQVMEGKSLYELDFTKKATPPLPEPNEIIEFIADNYLVNEGSLASIKWNVRGNGKIHISNIGFVEEKSGSKKIVLKNTTSYLLTIGEKTRQFTIHVQPKPEWQPPEKPQTLLPKTQVVTTTLPPPVILKKQATVAAAVKVKPVEIKKEKRKFDLKGISIFTLVAILCFFGFRYLSDTKQQQITEAATTQPATNTNAITTTFTDAGVRSFLTSLYQAYNSREIGAIMPHYAASVTNYYDAKTVSRDSLTTIISDLFITPARYNCNPDFTTMTIVPQTENCKVVITIKEKVKSNSRGRTENFTTKIEYQINPSYKIISEQTPG